MADKHIIVLPHGAYVGELVEITEETINAVWIPKIGPIDAHLHPVRITTGYTLTNVWFLNGISDLEHVYNDLEDRVNNLKRTRLPHDIWLAREYVNTITTVPEAQAGPDWD